MAKGLRVEIIGDPRSYSRALGRATADTRTFGKTLGGLGSTFGRFTKGVALAAGAAGIGGLAITMKRGFDEAAEGAKVMAQTNAVLASTAGVANVSAKEVEGLAQQLSNLTGVDDENIQAGENWLLTFKNIRNEVGAGNDIFRQATTVTLDLAAAQAAAKGSTIDMASASTLMGKALNDPLKGMTALGKAGVTFTDAQKESIKTLMEHGNVLGAQKVILAEVKSQVEGSAKAYGETFPGQLAKLRNSFDEIAGQIFSSVLPALEAGTKRLSGFLQAFGEAEGARAKFKVLIDGVKNVGTDVFNAVKASIGKVNWAGVWAEAKVTVTGLLTKLNAALDTADWKRIGKGIGTAIVAATEFAGELAKKMTAEIGRAASNVDWKQAFVGLVKGLKGDRSIPEAVKDVWLFSFKHGPTGQAMEHGKDIYGNIAKGFGSRARSDMSFSEIVKEKARQAGAAGVPVASSGGASIGAAMGAGMASGVLAQAQAVANAAISLVVNALAAARSAAAIKSPSMLFAEKVGKPLAEGVVVGFTSAMAARGAEFAAPLQKAALEIVKKINELKPQVADAFRSMAQNALSAFDEAVAKWVPPSQILLDKINAEKIANEVKGAVETATTAANAAANAYAAAQQKEGESDEEYLARKEQLYADVLSADKTLKDAQQALILYNLAEQAKAEQIAHDKKVAKDRERLAGDLLELQGWLKKHPEQYAEVNRRIIRIMKAYHIPMHTAGRLLAEKLGDGFSLGLDTVVAAARRLANEIEKITGPVGGGSATGTGGRVTGGHAMKAAGGPGVVNVTVQGALLGSTVPEVARTIRRELDRINMRNGVALA